MKRMLLVAVLLTVGANKSATRPAAVPEVHIEYDEVRDITKYFTDHAVVKLDHAADGQRQVFFELLEEKQGSAQRKPSSDVILGFGSVGVRPVYDEAAKGGTLTVDVLIGGKRYSQPAEGYKSVGDGPVTEALSIPIPIKKLVEMGRSQHLAMEIGEARFTLTPEQMGLIRTFAIKVQQAAPPHRRSR